MPTNSQGREPDIRLPREESGEVAPERLSALSIELAEKAGAIQGEGGQSEQLMRVQSELVNVDNPDRFNLAQRRLEAGGQWTDMTRELALEINRADQEQRGEHPLSFDEAKTKLEAWTESDLKGPDVEQKRDALQRDSALRGISRTETTVQLDSANTLLQEVERLLTSYQQRDSARTPLYEAEVREYRAIRDALLLKREEIIVMREWQAKEQAENAESEVRADEARQKVAKAHGEAAQITTQESTSNEQSGLQWNLLTGRLEKPGAYNQYKGSEAVLIVAQEVGVDINQFAAETIAVKQRIVAESMRQRPEKPLEAHEAFAVKRLLEQIDQNPEYRELREALNRFADANVEKLGGSGQRMIADEKIIGDFIKTAEELSRRQQ